MSFKHHLLIVCAIIVVIYFAWTAHNAPKPVIEAPPPTKESRFSIEVAHASWGLNCHFLEKSSSDDGYNAHATRTPSKLHEDNVLVAVSDLCNGKLTCDITANASTLGSDIAKDCSDKELVVEYRCFSYDRPWRARGASKVTLDCDKPDK